MQWDNDIDLSRRKMSTRLIVRHALRRGWRVQAFDTCLPLLRLYVTADKPVAVYSASPPDMSYVSSKIAKDKFITNSILKEAGLPVPEELLFLDTPGDAGVRSVESFLSQHGSLVVKPLDASHGSGVTVGVRSVAAFEEAYALARHSGRGSSVVVQEQIGGLDLRVLCIDYEYVDAISRTPARVFGDGESTVRELITRENLSDDRGSNYSRRLNVIDAKSALRFLGEDGMARVPAVGEEFQVVGVSNIGKGGERVNAREDIPAFMKRMACDAARELGLPVCGVDFMVSRQPVSTDLPEDLGAKIIEVNECPMLTMYDDVDGPEQSAIIERYLDHVARCAAIQTERR